MTKFIEKHEIQRTKDFGAFEDIQKLILLLDIENAHPSESRHYKTTWNWIGEGSDPYAIDGVIDEFDLEALKTKRLLKELNRDPILGVGATHIDKIRATVDLVVGAETYEKQIEYKANLRRLLASLQKWDFNDQTFQGWTNDGCSFEPRGEGYSLSKILGTVSRMIYRTFNFSGITQATIRAYWSIYYGGYGQIRLYDVDKSELILDWTPVGDSISGSGFFQREIDISEYVSGKGNVRVDLGASMGTQEYVFMDDVELEVS